MTGIADLWATAAPFGARPTSRVPGPLLASAGVLIAILVAGAAARGSVVEPAAAPGPAPVAAPLPAPAVEPAPAPPASRPAGPVRLTGLAGINLNAALAEAGVPDAIAQAYLRALAGRIRLADGISVADRFDLVIAPDSGRSQSERLLYAGLDRVGASDVQLMRWSVDGQTGWMDAAGVESAAEAMRMPVAASVSSSFGMRRHPLLGSHRFHRGVDLRAGAGTPIRASADGRVVAAGWNGGYGRQVTVDHGAGLATTYAHMSRLAARAGQSVHRGEIIGFVGSSGLSTGPHLHYEVLKNGRAVNPLTVRYVGNAGLEREERSAFNARLRQLLSFTPGRA